MKTIFITSFHALISRNILQTAVLRTLLARGARVVLIVPPNKVDFFKEEFHHPHVLVEGITVPKKTGEDFFTFISYPLVGVENHLIRGLKTEGSWGSYYLAHAIHRCLSPFFFPHRIMRFIARTYFRTTAFDHLFTTYAPDLVFTTDSFYREDRALITEAKKRGIRTVGMTRSWDNPTTKGVFLSVPDQVIATNEVVKGELVAIHRLNPAAITVTGIPHYDAVGNPPTLSREAFAARLGLDLKKKWILYAPGGKILYEHDNDILALLKRLVDTNAFSMPVQFIVRFSPGDTLDTQSVAGDPNFIIDDPGTNVTGRKKESELSYTDQEHLHNSLHRADVVMTLASTMIIDGMAYGKPVVVFGFDPKSGLSDPIEKFTRYVHLHKLLGSGLVAVGKSEDEFLELIREALHCPEKEREHREEVVRRYAYRLDGHSGERVANAVLAALS